MYKIRGADQQEYGPVGLEELRQWIAQGRVNAQTPVQGPDAPDWRPAGNFPELGFVAGGATPPMAESAAPKPSGLAIASLVLGVLGFCSGGLTGIAGVIVGVVALAKISKSQGQMGGKGLAVAGTCVSAFSLLMTLVLAGLLLPALASAKSRAQTVSCVNNVKQINLALRIHANDNNDILPKAEKWCDDIMPEAGSPRIFTCPAGPAGQRSHYALNAKLSGMSLDKVNPQTVMIFECAGGWNVSGGPSNMIKHHRVYVVGFVDGSVQQVSEARLSTLRWDP
jgi:hypothetical protein